MSQQPESWYPEIMYEEESKIPFVPVPEGCQMPGILFMFESRETGEFEPGTDGEPMPIVEMNLFQYANMALLKDALTGDEYDRVRDVLGLEPLQVASEKGRKLTDNVRSAVEKK
tara:strand:- start:1148 stop:1489 length:342 start_codon:yes stop_codon:yes gene_type:complete